MQFQYRKEIDGLRAIAMMSAIFFHLHLLFQCGFVGVDIFFVISGYLIVKRMTIERLSNTFTLKQYFAKRIRRIVPPLLFVLLGSCILSCFIYYPADMKVFCKTVLSSLFFVSNVFLSHQGGYFDRNLDLNLLRHLWSLAVEEQFYLSLPLIMVLVWRFGGKKLFSIVVHLLIAGAFVYTTLQNPFSRSMYFDFFVRIWEVLLGASLYLSGLEKLNRKPLNTYMSWLGLFLIIYVTQVNQIPTAYFVVRMLLTCLGSGLIILFATEDTPVGRFLCMKWLNTVGLATYSIYLLYQPVIAFLSQFFNFQEPLILGAVSLSIITSIGLLSWKYIEGPFRNPKIISNKKFILYMSILLILNVAFAVGGLSDGYMLRFDGDVRARMKSLDEAVVEKQKVLEDSTCHNSHDSLRFNSTSQCLEEYGFKNLKKLPVLFVGDSRALDVTLGLKLNGYLPMQLRGASCPVVPSKFSTSGCKDIFANLQQILSSDESKSIKYIALVNNFNGDGLGMKDIREMVAYWKKFGKELIYFSKLVIFEGFELEYTKTGVAAPAFKTVDYSEREELVNYLKEQNVHVVHATALFCGSSRNCPVEKDGKVLFVDNFHLSKYGAGLFGSDLIKNDPLFSHITQFETSP